MKENHKIKNRKIGVYLFLISIVFGLAETIYFGMNMFPTSGAERICDGITLLICILGIIIYKKSE